MAIIVDAYKKGQHAKNDYNEIWTVVGEDDKNYKKVKDALKGTEKTTNLRINFVVSAISKDKPDPSVEEKPYTVAQIFGGLNGSGEWTDYLDDLCEVVRKLDAWIIALENDCCDDVFTIELAFR